MAIRWHGDEFKRLVETDIAARMVRMASQFQSLCKIAVSKSNTDRVAHRSKRLRSRKVRYANMHNAYAGRPPRLRTGHGRASIMMEFNGSRREPVCRVGVTRNGIYMAYLELGTRRVAARPWLRATLDKNRNLLERAFALSIR